MKRVLVIADDLSGAAEIGGICRRFGLRARVVRDEAVDSVGEGVMVIDTDSRSMGVGEAGERVRRVVGKVAADATTSGPGGSFDLVYKKTDSVLRGAVGAEVEAVMGVMGVSRALLVPQNPSRGRTIVKGEYRIEGMPLDRTSFSEDPEHPTRTANVVELVGWSGGVDVRHLEPGEMLMQVSVSPTPNPCRKGRGVIAIGGAASRAEVRGWARAVGPGVLAGGGADFFETILVERGLMMSGQRDGDRVELGERVVFVCGSASRRQELVERAGEEGVGVFGMPDEVFHGRGQCGGLEGQTAGMERWCDSVVRALDEGGRAVVVVLQPVDRSAGAGERVQRGLAEVVACVLEKREVDNLLMEGGSTASAVCRRMGWRELEVEGEVSAGVVQMRAAGQRVVVKPGSYVWPDAVL